MNSQTSSILFLVVGLVLMLFVAFLTYSSFKHSDVFGTGKRKTVKALPAIARDMGLEFIHADDDESVGGLKGIYKGFLVQMSPDDPSVIDVDLNKSMEVDISDHKAPVSGVSNMVSFDFSSDPINLILTTRFASEQAASSLADSKPVLDFLESFTKKWASDLARFEVNNDILSVRFKHGMQGYVPSEKVMPMIEDLVMFAKILESETTLKY